MNYFKEKIVNILTKIKQNGIIILNQIITNEIIRILLYTPNEKEKKTENRKTQKIENFCLLFFIHEIVFL